MRSALSEGSLRQVENVYRRVFAKTVSVATPEIAEFLHLFETAGLDDPQPLQEVQLVPSSFKKVFELWRESQNEEDSAISEKLHHYRKIQDHCQKSWHHCRKG